MHGPDQERPLRRLAAVLFADIVGFTRLSGLDERRSLRLVEHFEGAVRVAVAEHEGTLVKFMGDGTLCHFPSTESAARAALRLQEEFRRRTEADGFHEAALRTGVHVGDIVIRADADVLGDGVNVASRVQSVAGPGQVVVSEEAWRHLRHLSDFRLHSLGPQRFKGVEEPREVYELQAADEDLPPRPSSRLHEAPPALRGVPLASPRTLSVGLGLVLLLFAASQLLPGREEAPGDDTLIRSLIVLPFDNLSGDPEEEFFVQGMHDALIGELTELGLLRVISRTSAMRYRGSTRSLEAIARELNVDAIVAASVIRSGGQIRIRAELIRVFPEEESVWAGTFDREFQDVLALHSDLARSVAEAIQIRLSPEASERLGRAKIVNPDAYEAYLRGRFHWELHTAQDLDLALRYFHTALELDPDYAPAHAGIASVWYGRRQLGTAPPDEASREVRAAVERALALDSLLSQAHHALAVDIAWHDWDWDAAQRQFERALELNPGEAITRSFYALVLRITHQFNDALAQARRAAELDPFNPIVQGIVAGSMASLGQMQEALVHQRRTLADNSNHPIVLADLATLAHTVGELDEALAATRARLLVDGDLEVVSELDSGLAEGGYREAMRRAALLLEDRSGERYVSPMAMARFHLQAGDHDRALDWLERAVDERNASATYFGGPFYAPLFSNPRFLALIDRVGLPHPTPTGT